jgi:hypothetical protein
MKTALPHHGALDGVRDSHDLAVKVKLALQVCAFFDQDLRKALRDSAKANQNESESHGRSLMFIQLESSNPA